jgi:hypothetical protein
LSAEDAEMSTSPDGDGEDEAFVNNPNVTMRRIKPMQRVLKKIVSSLLAF